MAANVYQNGNTCAVYVYCDQSARGRWTTGFVPLIIFLFLGGYEFSCSFRSITIFFFRPYCNMFPIASERGARVYSRIALPSTQHPTAETRLVCRECSFASGDTPHVELDPMCRRYFPKVMALRCDPLPSLESREGSTDSQGREVTRVSEVSHSFSMRHQCIAGGPPPDVGRCRLRTTLLLPPRATTADCS